MGSEEQGVEPTTTARMTPVALQRHAVLGGGAEDHLSVILIIDTGDADGVRAFNEALPVSVVRGLLDPGVENFFLPIAGMARPKPPRAKAHYLHTSYIREVVLLDELPPLEETPGGSAGGA